MRRVGKIRRRKVFPKVKNVNVESPKKRSNLLFFSARSFLFPLQECSWMGSSRRLSFFWGARIDFVWNTNWTRVVHELFTICSELMRQLMGINGETFLAGSASFLKPFWNINVHEFDSLKAINLFWNTKRAKCSEINEAFNETINGH